ncbi:MAG TPA: RNA helicase, partial [Brevundimonas sp.]|nr:RNA helicase [Brevundimonas sp.]
DEADQMLDLGFIKSIPDVMTGRDLLGIAQTGTGKTAAFALPILHRLAANRVAPLPRTTRCLVLSPTRELASQIAESFKTYGKHLGFRVAVIFGGVKYGGQERALNQGLDILVAAPGRLLDHIQQKNLDLSATEIFVLDEADQMLDLGFIKPIRQIVSRIPAKRQNLFFSATMPPEITRLTTQFLKDPTRIEASRPAMTAETITQYLVRIPGSDPKLKREALRALVGRDDVKNGIVFCNRKSEVNVVAKSLKQHGFDASPIHGDLDQSLRTKTLADFRSGALKILVASDVAARGLDIPDVSHVFNYDVAHNADDYVHRIGRTGRAGKTGQTFMIVTPSDDRSLDKVLKLIKMTPEELTLDLSSGGKARPAKTESAKAADEGAAVEKPTRSRRQASPAVAEETSGEAPARRSRSRRKPLSETAEVETETAPVEVRPVDQPIEAPKPEASDAEPRKRSRSRGGRGRKSDGAPEARSDTNARKDNDARKDSAPIKASDSSAFGNDGVPAFLRRPI